MRTRLSLVAALLYLPAVAMADGPPSRYRLVSPRADGIEATAINERGDVVGFEWVESTVTPGVVEQKPFFARGKQVTYLPLLKGYTATFPAGVSDDGTVVGRASKPAPPGLRVPLRNQAFVWDAERGIRGLGTLEGDLASFGCAITDDARTISGYSVGEGRLRACVWDREGDGWKAEALPHEGGLGSTIVAISRNGRFATAVDGKVPCLWSRNDAGKWKREPIGRGGTLVPRAVNDTGLVVGLRFDDAGETHAAIWTRDRGVESLAEPEGFRRSEALAVDNRGAVVGWVDGPRGSHVGPDPFIHEGGKVRLLTELGPMCASATAINDQGQVAGVVESKEEEGPADAKAPPRDLP